MSLLSRHRYTDLAHLLNIPAMRIKEIARFISENLNPFPARAHWGEINIGSQGRQSNIGTYQYPDIIISLLSDQEDTPLVIEIAMPIAGTLRVNPLFREAVRQAPSGKEEEWKADLEQATLLVKCIQQRNHTIVRLMEQLAVLQRVFILHGEAYLMPITRASLAKALDVHESTISRAVSSKAVQLPNGHIVPLAMFFDRSLHIRTALKKIIEQENQPLSDTDLGELLAGLGYPVARRTVAEYRAMEGILPAHLRKPNRYSAQEPELLSV
jgi:RNA polymerase sigma-54 factor